MRTSTCAPTSRRLAHFATSSRPQILSFLRPHVRPGARVLDVGCGFGSFLLRAREAGYAVAGIEPDAACVRGRMQGAR